MTALIFCAAKGSLVPGAEIDYVRRVLDLARLTTLIPLAADPAEGSAMLRAER